MRSLILLAFLVACGPEVVILNDHDDRITELERRAGLNDILNQEQNTLIQINNENLLLLSSQLYELEDELKGLISDEAAARLAGDHTLSNSLAVAILAQSMVNWYLQYQIDQLGVSLADLNSDLVNLFNLVNSLEDRMDVLEFKVKNLRRAVHRLRGSMLSEVDVQEMINSSVDQLELVVNNNNYFTNISNTLNVGPVINQTINNITEVTNVTAPVSLVSGGVQIGNQCLGLDVIKTGNGNGQPITDVELVLITCP